MAELYDISVQYENEVIVAAEQCETVVYFNDTYNMATEACEMVTEAITNDEMVTEAITNDANEPEVVEPDMNGTPPEVYEAVMAQGDEAMGTQKVFRCGDCFKLLSSLHSLKRHMLLHDPSANRPKAPLKYQCEICNKGFATPYACNQHMDSHRGIKKFQCGQCLKLFSQKSIAQHHMLAVHTPGSKVYKCTYEGCRRAFVVEYKLKNHLRMHYRKNAKLKESKWMCLQCDERFYSEYELKHHMLIHSSQQFKCDVCGKLSSSRQRLHIHKKIHTQENNYQCQVCLKKFIGAYGFRTHVQQKCGRDAYKYKCDKCLRCFFKEESLEAHLRSHARGRQKYVCGTCQRTYAQLKSLSNHCRTNCHEASDVYFSCKVCRAKFASMEELDEHMESHTAEELDSISKTRPSEVLPVPIPCRQCGKTFESKSKLMWHITEEHTMAYVCKVCGERFKRNEDVRSHMKTIHNKK